MFEQTIAPVSCPLYTWYPRSRLYGVAACGGALRGNGRGGYTCTQCRRMFSAADVAWLVRQPRRPVVEA